ncbi:MAG: Gfo/Idh/MocA family oxidoreductase [Gemmatimonadota bacterium]|nr:Gfo/Idh/MocA family oxidoreductase [Gemmatimonadota bacterium]
MAEHRKTRETEESVDEKTVRVAMIGAGGRATSAHYPSLKALNGVEMVAVSELSEQRMADAAARFGIPGQYPDYRQMIEKVKPDAVYTIMPPHHLYDIAATVMEAGCHLFIEKPPAMTTEQTRQMALIAQKHEVLTGVTFQRRFAPVIRYGKELCEKRGAVHSAVATFYKNAVGGAPYYRGAIDILTSDAIHAVDTLRYLCGGEVASVASDVRREDATHTNIYLALVKFSSGATGVLLTNWMTGRRIFSVEIHSPGISVFGDPEEGGRVFADNKDEPVEVLDPFRLGGGDDTWRAYGAYDINRHFMDCVRVGKQPETCFDDAVKTMELVDLIYQSQI